MLVEILLAIISAVIPIMWFHIKSKIEATGFESLLLTSKEVQELYEIVLAKLKELLKDGKLSEEDRELLKKLALEEAKKRGIKLFSLLSPKAYKFLLQKMIDRLE